MGEIIGLGYCLLVGMVLMLIVSNWTNIWQFIKGTIKWNVDKIKFKDDFNNDFED